MDHVAWAVVVAWLFPLALHAQPVAGDVRIAPNSKAFLSPTLRGFETDLA